jgi:hypothetical protein
MLEILVLAGAAGCVAALVMIALYARSSIRMSEQIRDENLLEGEHHE